MILPAMAMKWKSQLPILINTHKGTSKNQDFLVRARKLRAENRSV